jgi:hypothetical protein
MKKTNDQHLESALATVREEKLTTLLHNLPEYEVDNSGSGLSKAVKGAGYDVSPRNLINGWNCWNTTVEDFLKQLSETNPA